MQPHSESIDQIITALSKAQGEMTPAVKDSVNPHFKNKYASLEAIWDCCRGPLSKNGLSIVQMIEKVEANFILVTMLAHSSGQWIKSFMPISAERNTSQAFGSALTYMKRYSLAAIIGVVSEEDDDGESERKCIEPTKKITSAQYNLLNAKSKKLSATQAAELNKWLASNNISSLANLPSDFFDEIDQGMNAYIQQNV